MTPELTLLGPELVIHQPSGVVYLACSNPINREHWMPTVDRLNVSGKLDEDYVAVYNPATSKVSKLNAVGFDSPRGLSLHGMDVVASESNPAELYIYLVNHRTPLGDKKASEVGADSSIEIFKTTVGGSTFIHLNTIEDPTIIAPNDIVGSADGKSFHFTNDHGAKRGFVRNHYSSSFFLSKQCFADATPGPLVASQSHFSWVLPRGPWL